MVSESGPNRVTEIDFQSIEAPLNETWQESEENVREPWHDIAAATAAATGLIMTC